MLLSLDCRLEREAGRPPLRRELPLSDGGFGSAKPQPLIGEEERFSVLLGAVSGRPPSKGGVDPGNPLGDFTAGRVAARMSSVLEPRPPRLPPRLLPLSMISPRLGFGSLLPRDASRAESDPPRPLLFSRGETFSGPRAESGGCERDATASPRSRIGSERCFCFNEL